MLQLPRAHDSGNGKGDRVTTAPDFIQHINIKIFTAGGAPVDLDETVKVFHRWIRDKACPELLIDVAEYPLVHAGPGVMLIGHEANYSIDNRDSRMGLLYNRKAVLDGDFQSRLAQAHRAALAACDALEREPKFHGKLKFDRDAMEVFVNDRLLAPNNDETWTALEPELARYFAGYRVERVGEPRDLFRVAIAKG